MSRTPPAAIISTGTRTEALQTAEAIETIGAMTMIPSTPKSSKVSRAFCTEPSYGSSTVSSGGKEQGFYAAFGERNEDVGSISAPVFDHAGRLACAIGLGFPTQRIGPGDVERLGPVVARAGLEANRALGYDSSQAAPV